MKTLVCIIAALNIAFCARLPDPNYDAYIKQKYKNLYNCIQQPTAETIDSDICYRAFPEDVETFFRYKGLHFAYRNMYSACMSGDIDYCKKASDIMKEMLSLEKQLRK